MNIMILLMSLLSLQLWGQSTIYENSVNFSIRESELQRGNIQFASEWLTPSAFYQHPLSFMDFDKQVLSQFSRSQVVLSMESFVTNASFDELSFQKLNQASIIKLMFDSLSISKKGEIFSVTNKVKAYGFPINLHYDVRLNQESKVSIPLTVKNWFKNKIKHLSVTSRSQIIVIETFNFSQLMFKNTGIVFFQELTSGDVIIIATGLSTIDINKANLFFPFGMAKNQMLSNVENQMIHMAQKIQDF